MNHEEIVLSLMTKSKKSKINLDAKNNKKETAFDLAIMNKSLDIIQAILTKCVSKHIYINLNTKNNETAFHIAVREKMKILLGC